MCILNYPTNVGIPTTFSWAGFLDRDIASTFEVDFMYSKHTDVSCQTVKSWSKDFPVLFLIHYLFL